MSSTVDVNVLLYASDESSPFHGLSLELLDRLAKGPIFSTCSGRSSWGTCGCRRNGRSFPRPLSPEDAVHNVEQLVRLPHARIVGEAEGFWGVYVATTSGVVVRGNLVPDAHLVA
jgi:predicted nucleic acid-binding protein